MVKKIYYWDGALNSCPHCNLDENSKARVIWVDAALGWRFNESQLEYCNIPANPVDYIVVTNQPLALDFDLVADRGETIPNVKEKVYLFHSEKIGWLPIEDFTDKELRFAHNILKMYLAGCFEGD